MNDPKALDTRCVPWRMSWLERESNPAIVQRLRTLAQWGRERDPQFPAELIVEAARRLEGVPRSWRNPETDRPDLADPACSSRNFQVALREWGGDSSHVVVCRYFQGAAEPVFSLDSGSEDKEIFGWYQADYDEDTGKFYWSPADEDGHYEIIGWQELPEWTPEPGPDGCTQGWRSPDQIPDVPAGRTFNAITAVRDPFGEKIIEEASYFNQAKLSFDGEPRFVTGWYVLTDDGGDEAPGWYPINGRRNDYTFLGWHPLPDEPAAWPARDPQAARIDALTQTLQRLVDDPRTAEEARSVLSGAPCS